MKYHHIYLHFSWPDPLLLSEKHLIISNKIVLTNTLISVYLETIELHCGDAIIALWRYSLCYL